MATQTAGKRKSKPKSQRKSRAEVALSVADLRIAGLTQIALGSKVKILDLGGGVTTGTVTAARDHLSELLQQQAELATLMNSLRMQIVAETRTMRDFNKRVLELVKGRYGDDSQEYKQVGGTPRSQYKKPVRAPRTRTASPSPQSVPTPGATPTNLFATTESNHKKPAHNGKSAA